jgi:hypothetical protein
MQKSPSLKADSSSASHEIPSFYEGRSFITAATEPAPGAYTHTDGYSPHSPVLLFGTFAGQLRKAAVSFVKSVCPSVCPHETNSPPNEQVLMIYTGEVITTCRPYLSLAKIWQI